METTAYASPTAPILRRLGSVLSFADIDSKIYESWNAITYHAPIGDL
jgi:hypothetical protein